MTTIKEDLMALRAFVAPFLPPTTTYSMQSIPDQPAGGMLAIQLADGGGRSLTRAHTQRDRLYQFVYFGATNIDVIDRMSELEQAFNANVKITANGGSDFLTVGSFSMSQRFKTENNVEAMIGMLEVTTHEIHITPTEPKVGTVSMTLKTKE